MKKVQWIAFVLLCPLAVIGRPADTIAITPETIQPSRLPLGKSCYLVYIQTTKDAPPSNIQVWNREAVRDDYDGQQSITVIQEWYGKDTVIHRAKSVSRTGDFKPLYHQAWWRDRGETIRDQIDDDYLLNWHLDLEVFSMLPYRKRRVFRIPFYDFGNGIGEETLFTVAGTDWVKFNGKPIHCWILEHEGDGYRETFWVSKCTRRVLKMEQLIKGTMYRYKVRMPD